MARQFTCAFAALTVLIASASSSASVGKLLASDAASPARSDGWGRIAYMRDPGHLQLLGYRGGPLYSLDVSAGCSGPRRLVGVGGGQVLLACDPAADVARLEIASRTLQPVPGAHEAIVAASAPMLGFGAFTAIGAYGVRFESTAYREPLSISTLDWRTGALTPAPESATTTQDLDQPGFSERLCEPLTRNRRHGQPTEQLYDPVWPGWRVVVLERRGIGLTAEQCESGRRWVLWPSRRSGVPAADVQRDGEIVTWTVPRSPDRVRLGVRLHGYLPECGVTMNWHLAPYARAAGVRDGLVVSEATASGGPWRIRRIPIGDVCTHTLRAWTLVTDDGINTAETGPRAATLGLPRAGTVAVSLDPRWPVRRTVHPDGLLRLQPGNVPGIVRSVRARLGRGAWRSARRGRLDWRLRLPTVATPRPLEIVVRYHIGVARYRVSVAPRLR